MLFLLVMTRGCRFLCLMLLFEGPFGLLLSAAISPHHRDSCGGMGKVIGVVLFDIVTRFRIS